MVKEGEEFTTEDEANRKKIEALNSLQNYVWEMKTDSEETGSHVSEEDKNTISAAIKETEDWIEEHGADADAETFEEKVAELQAVINAIVGDTAGGS